MMLYRNTYLEINLDFFHSNVRAILNSSFTDFCFVLKANAYGHGSSVIAKELNQYNDITIIAVATLNEALKIKKVTNKAILILGYLEDNLLEVAVKNQFIITIFEASQAKIINRLNKTKVFIKVDTGFHRLGKLPTEKFLKEIIEINELENIIIEGIYSHLRLVTVEDDNKQYQLFKTFCKKLKDNGVYFKYKSIKDSIALTRHPDYKTSLPRIGSLMFGLSSSKETNKINVTPVQTLKTIVTNIIDIDFKGFGYSSKQYPKVKKIATLSIGYADGLPREISHKAYALVNNHQVSIVGLPSMDQLSIDVTSVEVSKGDEVILFGGKGITLEKLSSHLKTNKNELISQISSRVPKVYIKANKIRYILDEIVGELDEY